MEQDRLQARFVPGWVVAVLFGIAVFLAVDFLFAGALPTDSRALLGRIAAIVGSLLTIVLVVVFGVSPLLGLLVSAVVGALLLVSDYLKDQERDNLVAPLTGCFTADSC